MASSPPLLFDDFKPVSKAEWLEKIQADLRGADYEKKVVWKTPDGLTIDPVIIPEDLASLNYLTSYHGRLSPTKDGKGHANGWIICQPIEATHIDATLTLIETALQEGADAVEIRITLPVGSSQVGSNTNQVDFDRILDTIAEREGSLHLVLNTSSPASLKQLASLIKTRHRTDKAMVSGTVNVDPMVPLLQTGQGDIGPTYEALVELVSELNENDSSLRAIAIDLRPYDEAGASEVQVLALALAATSEYFSQLSALGLDFQTIAEHLHVIMPVGTSFFKEIAKLRAFRLLYPHIAAAYDNGLEGSPLVHAITSKRYLTLFDPYVNLLRNTTAVAAAGIAGADVISVQRFDTALKNKTDHGNRLSKNTQIMLKGEGYLDLVKDVAGGSYYIETVTDQISEQAWSLFQDIESRGGLLAALQSGFIQEAIQESAENEVKRLASRRTVLLGTNQFPDLHEHRLHDVAEPRQYTQPLSGDESSDEVTTIAPLVASRLAEQIEELRLRTEAFAHTQGVRPSVFLLPIGDPAMRTARANFVRNFFGCGGFEIKDHLGFETPEEGAKAALRSGAEIVVVCSADRTYEMVIPSIVEQLKQGDQTPALLVAGYPKASIEALMEAGVDDFVHVRSNLVETLGRYQTRLGILS